MDGTMNLNQMSKEIHKNAVAHGWWDYERDDDEIIALIHSECEWSEALEEYRHARPMKYFETDHSEKPEGIAVELVDGCIRILDFMRKVKVLVPGAIKYPVDLIHAAEQTSVQHKEAAESDLWNEALPRIISLLHFHTAMYSTEKSRAKGCEHLLNALGVVFLWLSKNGVDPAEIMVIKHEYNVTRAYRHGNKVC